MDPETGVMRGRKPRRTNDVRNLEILQRTAAIATGAMAVLSLVGWFTGAKVLASGSMAYVPMVPLTALIFLVLSGLLVIRLRVRSPWASKLSLAAIVIIWLMVTFNMLDLLTGLPIGPDRLFFPSTSGPDAAYQWDRMSPMTALGCLGLSLAMGLFELRASRLRSAATNLSLIVATGAFIMVVGYSFDAPLLYGGSNLFAVALPASVGLLLLGIAVAALGREQWPFALFTGDSVRAWLMRAVVPIAIVPMLAFVVVDTVLFHLIGFEENPLLLVALFMLMFSLVMTFVLKAATWTGDRLDAAEAALQVTGVELTSTLHEQMLLFEHMSEGLALHEMVFDDAGEPLDYRFLHVNPAYETVTGLRSRDIVGRTVREVTPDIDPALIRRFGAVVSTGTPSTDEDYSPALDRHLRVTAYSLGKDRFAVVVTDVTQRKLQERDAALHHQQLEELLEQRALNVELLGRSLSSIIEVVSQVTESRDPFTAGHQKRVAELAVRISDELGRTAQETEQIRIAAILHDVGKMSVPAEILSKPGPLSAAEYELVKEHAEAGFGILKSVDLDGPASEIVHQHHERCDGSGYPQGLNGDQLLEGARVLAVADVVEAMVSHRPYRAGLGLDAALSEIEQGSGTLYDARVVESCVRLFRELDFDFSSGQSVAT